MASWLFLYCPQEGRTLSYMIQSLWVRAYVWNEDVSLNTFKHAASQSETGQTGEGAFVLGILVCNIRIISASWENAEEEMTFSGMTA